MYINNQSQYDIVSMAKLFHNGFYAKYKNGAAYLDSRKILY